MSMKMKVKYVSDIAVEDNSINIKKPFKISKEEQRRFIRIEIAAPVALRNVREELTEVIPAEKFYNINGTILNISPGGVLVETDAPIMEQDLVVMRFTIQDTTHITNVLGLVKRVDHEDDAFLLGIEFIKSDKLNDRLSTAEMTLLDETVGTFENRVQETLSEYLY